MLPTSSIEDQSRRKTIVRIIRRRAISRAGKPRPRPRGFGIASRVDNPPGGVDHLGGVQHERAITTLACSRPSFGIRARAMRSAPVPGTKIEVDDGPHLARRGANCCGGSGKVAKGGVRRQPDPLLRSSQKAHRPMTRDHTVRRSHSPSLHTDFAGRRPRSVASARGSVFDSNFVTSIVSET